MSYSPTEATAPGTLYAGMTKRQARLTALLFVTLAISCALRQDRVMTISIGRLPRDLGDSLVYRAVSSRVHAGESYYTAAAIGLETHGYPTSSVFHWRVPTYAWIFGKPPNESCGWLILVVCELVAIGMASSMVAQGHGLPMRLAVAASLGTADAWVVYPEPIYFMELWAGRLILISLCLYYNGYWGPGVAAGMLALLFRELALPFCAVMMGLACWRRLRKEILAWVAVLGTCAFLYCLHCLEVGRRGVSPSFSGLLAWVAFGGMTSLLSACRMNFLLTLLPSGVTSIYLPLALLGLLGWPARAAVPIKVTTVVYLAILAVVGQPFNFYWGWLFTSLLAIGIVWAPMAIRDLIVSLLK